MNSGAKLSKALAITLMLWCAGAGCLLVSFAREAIPRIPVDLSSASEESTSAPACHSHRQKTQEASTADTATNTSRRVNLPTPSRSRSMSCCPLTNGSIVSASRTQTNPDQSIAPADNTKNPAEASFDPAPLDVPLRLPNQHHLYLRGCAFLI